MTLLAHRLVLVLALIAFISCRRVHSFKNEDRSIPSPAHAVQKPGFVYSKTLLGYVDAPPIFPKTWAGFYGAEEFKVEAQILNGRVITWKALTPFSSRVPQEWLNELFTHPLASYKGRLDGQRSGSYVLFICNCNVGGMVGIGLFPESGPSIESP